MIFYISWREFRRRSGAAGDDVFGCTGESTSFWCFSVFAFSQTTEKVQEKGDAVNRPFTFGYLVRCNLLVSTQPRFILARAWSREKRLVLVSVASKTTFPSLGHRQRGNLSNLVSCMICQFRQWARDESVAWHAGSNLFLTICISVTYYASGRHPWECTNLFALRLIYRLCPVRRSLFCLLQFYFVQYIP